MNAPHQETTDGNKVNIEESLITENIAPDENVETTATVDELRNDTRGMTEEVIEGKIIQFPVEISIIVDALMREIAEMAQKNTDKRWFKTKEEAQKICALFALGYEYSSTVRSITRNIPVAASNARSYLTSFSISNLSEIEQKVLMLISEKLNSLLIKENGKQKRFTDDEKGMVLAMARLIRKRDLDTSEMHAELKKIGILIFNVMNWETAFMKEELLASTRSLVPKIFEEAERLVNMPEEIEILSGSNSSERDAQEDQKNITPANEAIPESNPHQAVDTTPVFSEKSNELSLSPSVLETIQEVTRQSGDLIHAIIENSVLLQNPLIIQLLEMNQAVLKFLMHNTDMSQSSNAAKVVLAPLSVGSGQISVNPETLELVKTGQIVVRATTTELVIEKK